MNSILQALFGSHWQTTLAGAVAAGAVAIADYLKALPDNDNVGWQLLIVALLFVGRAAQSWAFTKPVVKSTPRGLAHVSLLLGFALASVLLLGTSCAYLRHASVTSDDGLVCVSTGTPYVFAGYSCTGVCVQVEGEFRVRLDCQALPAATAVAKAAKPEANPTGEVISVKLARDLGLVK